MTHAKRDGVSKLRACVDGRLLNRLLPPPGLPLAPVAWPAGAAWLAGAACRLVLRLSLSTAAANEGLGFRSLDLAAVVPPPEPLPPEGVFMRRTGENDIRGFLRGLCCNAVQCQIKLFTKQNDSEQPKRKGATNERRRRRPLCRKGGTGYALTASGHGYAQQSRMVHGGILCNHEFIFLPTANFQS